MEKLSGVIQTELFLEEAVYLNKLISRDTAQAVKEDGVDFWDETETKYACPACGNRVYTDELFCKCCGQRLKRRQA